jgi:hypothetical protein
MELLLLKQDNNKKVLQLQLKQLQRQMLERVQRLRGLQLPRLPFP